MAPGQGHVMNNVGHYNADQIKLAVSDIDLMPKGEGKLTETVTKTKHDR